MSGRGRQPCERQSPRQDRSPGEVRCDRIDARRRGPTAGVKPRSRIGSERPGRPPFRSVVSPQAARPPDENQSGRGRDRSTGKWARTGRNAALMVSRRGLDCPRVSTRRTGTNLRRAQPHERRRTARGKNPSRPARSRRIAGIASPERRVRETAAANDSPRSRQARAGAQRCG